VGSCGKAPQSKEGFGAFFLTYELKLFATIRADNQ
jgi:hypothetical protein